MNYQNFLLSIKILFLALMIMEKVGILPSEAPVVLIVEDIFKVLLSLYLMYVFFPKRKQPIELNGHDYLLMFVAGILLISSVSLTDLKNSLIRMFQNIMKHVNGYNDRKHK